MWWLVAAAWAGASADRHGGPAPAKAGKSVARAAAKPAEVHWTYDGESGPSHWAELGPEFAQCSSGHSQTPIDLNSRYAEVVGLDDVLFHYHPGGATVVNNGHTIQVNLAPGNAIEVDSRYFELVQFHFHTPSEHRVDGKSYPLEVHLVHRDSAGSLAVVGILVDTGEPSAVLQPVFDVMPPKVAQEKPVASAFDPMALLPANHHFFRYSGSLTTPPCSEGVRWVVLDTQVTASAEQLGRFSTLFSNNARPIQALNGRTVLVDATP